MARPWAARLVGIGGFALLALVMFDVPAAYAFVRGAPPWLALIAGLLVFPVLPVTWHVVRERSRRAAAAAAVAAKKPVRKTQTTGWERFTFRTIVVAVVVIGSLIGFDRRNVWRGVRHHALWMIPYTESPLVVDSPLFAHVPSTAEAMVWVRNHDDAHAMLSRVSPKPWGRSELVLAVRGSEVMVLERGDAGLIEALSAIQKLVPKELGKVSTLPGGITVWSTAGWAPGSSRPTALIELMSTAADDVFVVAAARSKKIDSIEGGVAAVAWARVRADRFEAVAEVTTDTPLTAQRLADEARTASLRERINQPETFACGAASGGSTSFVQVGNAIRARATIALDGIRPLFECLDRAR